MTRRRKKPCFISIDIHEEDLLEHFFSFAEYIEKMEIKANIFIPSACLLKRKFSELKAFGSHPLMKFGSHGHAHSTSEHQALALGENLGFLMRSKRIHEDFFLYSPRFFRAPCWGKMALGTYRHIKSLGYFVDSSCTPQRLGVLSSYPLENPYLFSSRHPCFVLPELLEIPTTSFLVPLASPTFRTFRKTLSVLLMRSMILEQELDNNCFINTMFHIDDFDTCRVLPNYRLKLRDMFPVTPGGLRVKYNIRQRNNERNFKTTESIIASLARQTTEFYESFYLDLMKDMNNGQSPSRLSGLKSR